MQNPAPYNPHLEGDLFLIEQSSHAITLDCELDAVTELTLRFMVSIQAG